MSESPFKVGPPDIFDSQEMLVIEELVSKGKEVDLTDLPDNLRRAQVIGVKRDADRIVAVAVLKRIRRGYNQTRGDEAHSGHPLDPNATELGYVVSTLSGSGGAVSRAVLEHGHGQLFATVRTDNDKMRSTLEHTGFVEIPKAWRSTQHAGKEITLWVREPSAS
jgi:hypothetical protein